jgi:hypothetical protein
MKPAARFFEVLIRICGGGALVLGLAFWLGYARSFTRLHIWLGIAVVLSLWILAGIAWRNGTRRGVVALAAVWGALTWILGITQARLLPGSFHWVVAVLHLIVGLTAIALGSRLSRTVGARSIQSKASAYAAASDRVQELPND